MTGPCIDGCGRIVHSHRAGRTGRCRKCAGARRRRRNLRRPPTARQVAVYTAVVTSGGGEHVNRLVAREFGIKERRVRETVSIVRRKLGLEPAPAGQPPA